MKVKAMIAHITPDGKMIWLKDIPREVNNTWCIEHGLQQKYQINSVIHYPNNLSGASVTVKEVIPHIAVGHEVLLVPPTESRQDILGSIDDGKVIILRPDELVVGQIPKRVDESKHYLFMARNHRYSRQDELETNIHTIDCGVVSSFYPVTEMSGKEVSCTYIDRGDEESHWLGYAEIMLFEVSEEVWNSMSSQIKEGANMRFGQCALIKLKQEGGL